MAFIDNNISKKGTYLHGKIIITPDEIDTYVYDRILILSVYEIEIAEQLIKQLGIIQSIILNLSDMYAEMYSYYEETYHLSEKKILLVCGAKDNSEMRLSKIFINFKLAGRLSVHQLNQINSYEYDYILLWQQYGFSKPEEKRLWLEKIEGILISEYNVPKDVILDGSVRNVYEHNCHRCSFGEENQEKTFLVIRLGGGTGLMWMVQTVLRGIEYADEHGFIPVVDGMTLESQYHDVGEVGKVNVWEKFFEQPAGWKYEDIYKSKNIVLFTTGLPLKGCPKDLIFKPQIKAAIDKYWNEHDMQDKKILGVLFRGSDYANLKHYGSSIQPTLEEMVNTVKEKLIEWSCDGYDAIYLATEEEGAVARFEKEFGDLVLNYPQERVKKGWNKYLAEYPFKDDGYKRGVDYCAAIVILSRCESIIAGQCSGSSMALLFNKNKYANQYIFDLGTYGNYNK